MTIHILAEGDGWVVAAKPPRLLSHRNPFQPHDDALLQQLRDTLGQRVYLLHRLDYPTSGCVLAALSPERASALAPAFAEGRARKRYLAITRGQIRWPAPERVVENPMKDDNGLLKDATTTLRVLATCPEPRASLILARPHTGRYHQIRRHSRDTGHPLVGDVMHGDSKFNREFWEKTGTARGRLMLHCAALEVPTPEGGVIQARCPLYEDMAGLIERLFGCQDPELFPDVAPLLVDRLHLPLEDLGDGGS